MRAFRRLARMIHPDKNAHLLAKDAFQKLLGSSSRLRSHPLHPQQQQNDFYNFFAEITTIIKAMFAEYAYREKTSAMIIVY